MPMCNRSQNTAPFILRTQQFYSSRLPVHGRQLDSKERRLPGIRSGVRSMQISNILTVKKDMLTDGSLMIAACQGLLRDGDDSAPSSNDTRYDTDCGEQHIEDTN